MRIIGSLLLEIVAIYTFLVVCSAIFSWLIAFDVVNIRNRTVYVIWDFLNRVTEPPLRFIRRWVPSIGAVDISPIILLLALQFVLRPIISEIFGVYRGLWFG